MSARLTCWASVLVAALALSASSRVQAQAWLSDRSRAEGIGVRAGNLEIHPGLGTEIGYDSNVFLNDTQPQDSFILRVTPHLFLSTLGPQRNEDVAGPQGDPVLDFRFGGSLPIYYYFSTPQRARVEANVDLGLELLPRRPVSFSLNGKYNRTMRPFTQGLAAANYGRNTLNVRPQLGFQTVGGVLRAAIGGDFTYDFFDEGTNGFGIYDSMTYRAAVNAGWEFLPKTSLVYEGDVSFRDFQTDTDDVGPFRNDGTRWQFRMGLNGALSARLSATLMFGYTAAFFKEGDDVDDLTVNAELRWKPSHTITTSLGYDRTLTAAFQGNYHRNDRFGAKFELLAGGAFLFTSAAHFTLVYYGADPLDRNDRRIDQRLGGDIGGEYRFTDWLAMTANVGASTNLTDYEFESTASPTDPTPVFDPVKFTRFYAFLGMRIFY